MYKFDWRDFHLSPEAIAFQDKVELITHEEQMRRDSEVERLILEQIQREPEITPDSHVMLYMKQDDSNMKYIGVVPKRENEDYCDHSEYELLGRRYEAKEYTCQCRARGNEGSQESNQETY